MGVLDLLGNCHAGAVVPPVEPAGGGLFDVDVGAVRPRAKDGGADAPGFEQSDHRSYKPTFISVRDRSGRWPYALEVEVLDEGDGCVLTGFNRPSHHRLLAVEAPQV